MFSDQTFQLMRGLRANPTKAFYAEHKAGFVDFLEQPFKELLRSVIPRLPTKMVDVLETQKRLFGIFPKNDYGRGGAHTHYWGALYPRGGKRQTGPQLFLFLQHDRLEWGFSFGNQASEFVERLARNARVHRDSLEEALGGVDPAAYGFGDEPGVRDGRWHPRPSGAAVPDLFAVLAGKAEQRPRIARGLSADELLAVTAENLAEQIAEAFVELFPLVVASIEADYGAVIEDSDTEEGDDELNPERTLAEIAAETSLPQADLERWVRAIESKRQAVFYGPPGTGKTFVAHKLAEHLVGGGSGVVELVQFHPAYAYEDFIQGIRPEVRDGVLRYEMTPGRFLDFCREARRHEGRSVLIIDEINRANLARVFGELMYLLEYRDSTVPLAGGGLLTIPANVRIIGTMNTADRSIALVDHALRRRFAFIPLRPELGVLRAIHGSNGNGALVERLCRVLQRVNSEIADPNYEVGISFFVGDDLPDRLEDVWRMEIEPYLEEYFFSQRKTYEAFTWERVSKDLEG